LYVLVALSHDEERVERFSKVHIPGFGVCRIHLLRHAGEDFMYMEKNDINTES
jgi:hypothetical protein